MSLHMNKNYDENYKTTAVFMSKMAVFIKTNKISVKETVILMQDYGNIS